MSDVIKVYWFGYGGHSHLVEALRPTIESYGMDLITIHEWESANVKWDLRTWLVELKKADIIILPCDYKSFPAKSNNKLTQAMSLGKPVICSPLPAYLEIEKKHPGCCLFADSEDEWKEQLLRLRNSPDLRYEISRKAIAAAQDFHPDRITEKWINIFKSLSTATKAWTDIIIPTYANLTGLKLCLDSIRVCTPEKHRIIVVNNGNDVQTHEYLSKMTDIVYIKKGRMNFAQAVNEGIKASTGQYVVILNDDVIVSKGWLRNLISYYGKDIGVVGPLSNCDMGWLHQYQINIGGVNLVPGANTFDEIKPIINDLYEFKSPYFEVHERDWIAFYCVLISREVLNKVGLLNENFVNSGEDVDLCYRIKKMGYKIIQNYQSFVFHFGAVSRKILEKENPESYHESDRRTSSYLGRLWDKKRVMIYSGPSWERWDFRIIETSGIGGSETWQIWLSRELSKLNYRVINFADCSEPVIDGDIEWIPYTKYPEWVEQNWVDYAILSRTTDPLRFPLRAGKIFTQIHDIFYLSEKSQTFLDKINKHCVLSQWHRDFVRAYHGIPDEKIHIMSNGLDLSRYDRETERHPYRLFWSSSLDRGLDTLLYLFDFIKAEIPDLELHIFYGVFNWQELAKLRNDQNELAKIEKIKEGFKKPGVFYHGRVNQKQLAIEQMKSSLWLYPTDFEETFCITAIEAQAAGCPVIASNYAGLQTTIGDSGILIGNGSKGQSYTKECREEFVKKTIELLKNRDLWNYWSERGRENARKFSWANCAKRWKELFEKEE